MIKCWDHRASVLVVTRGPKNIGGILRQTCKILSGDDIPTDLLTKNPYRPWHVGSTREVAFRARSVCASQFVACEGEKLMVFENSIYFHQSVGTVKLVYSQAHRSVYETLVSSCFVLFSPPLFFVLLGRKIFLPSELKLATR